VDAIIEDHLNQGLIIIQALGLIKALLIVVCMTGSVASSSNYSKRDLFVTHVKQAGNYKLLSEIHSIACL
jgi:hypothetical protein